MRVAEKNVTADGRLLLGLQMLSEQTDASSAVNNDERPTGRGDLDARCIASIADGGRSG
jgi:hypothetical protein